MIISQELIDGKYITVYEASNPTEQYTFTDISQISEEVCEQRVFNMRFEEEHAATPKLEVDFYEYIDIIIMFVKHIKANPSINLTQFNTYVNNLHWIDAAIVRFFVVCLYKYALLNYPGTTQTSTELGVLAAVRDRIVALSYRKLSMIVTNQILPFDA